MHCGRELYWHYVLEAEGGPAARLVIDRDQVWEQYLHDWGVVATSVVGRVVVVVPLVQLPVELAVVAAEQLQRQQLVEPAAVDIADKPGVVAAGEPTFVDVDPASMRAVELVPETLVVVFAPALPIAEA